MERAQMIENIARAWAAACAEDRAEGRAWYRNAHGVAASLDARNPRRAAGILAALSPQVAWERNIALAADLYWRGTTSGTMKNAIRKAERILAGEPPEAVLKGPKVLAFYRLIAEPEDAWEVCVDRHATNVAMGARMSVDLRPAGRYEAFADAFREVGRMVGEAPATVQAVTWVAERRARERRRRVTR